MRFWHLLLLAALVGGVYELYAQSAVIYKSLTGLSFKNSGFESDVAVVTRPKKAPTVARVATSTRETTATVTRVVDGDTIVIDTSTKVRYIGVNAPESVDPRKPVECYGKEALEYNKSLVLNKKVRLVKDVSDKDKYGRLLRYVYLADGTFINQKLVIDGYANVMTIPPDVAFSKVFLAAEQAARAAKLGLWSACK